MKNKAILSLFIFGSILSANTVTVSLNSVSNPVTVPYLGNDLAGPYTMNVNGNLVPAMCMDDFRGVSGTWSATLTPVNSTNLSNTVLGNNFTASVYGYAVTGGQLYDMEAYLFSEIIKPNADKADLQLAAWALLDSNTLNTVVSHNDSTVENDLSGAYSAVTNPNSGFNPGQYEILTDVSGQNQEYIVATPEPSTCLLLGTGLMLAGLARFAKGRRKPALVIAN